MKMLFVLSLLGSFAWADAKQQQVCDANVNAATKECLKYVDAFHSRDGGAELNQLISDAGESMPNQGNTLGASLNSQADREAFVAKSCTELKQQCVQACKDVSQPGANCGYKIDGRVMQMNSEVTSLRAQATAAVASGGASNGN